MILLFNLDSFIPEKTTPQARPMLSQDDYLLRIEQGQYRLERVGQSWRQSQLESTSTTGPDKQLAAWQQAVLSPADAIPQDITSVEPYVAVVWLAGETQGQVFAFYPHAGQTYVKTQKQWFILKQATLPTLLPWNTTN